MDFSLRELKLAGYLLLIFRTSKDNTERLGDIVSPEYNPISKIVFLVDTDFNVAVLHHGYLVDWYICPKCHGEGRQDTLLNKHACCNAYIKSFFRVTV